jgi:hypothetical protein
MREMDSDHGPSQNPPIISEPERTNMNRSPEVTV